MNNIGGFVFHAQFIIKLKMKICDTTSDLTDVDYMETSIMQIEFSYVKVITCFKSMACDKLPVKIHIANLSRFNACRRFSIYWVQKSRKLFDLKN